MLTQTHIETIKTHFKNKGKKLEKILESAEFVNASLAAEEYAAPRGRAKAMKGVHQGLKNVRFGHREVAFDLQMAVGYGSASTGDFSNEDLAFRCREGQGNSKGSSCLDCSLQRSPRGRQGARRSPSKAQGHQGWSVSQGNQDSHRDGS